uniref:Uncharacterized protein n=1 Tax=Chelydra serpentina TaxID=8475 RepID=A0A8C3S354_CHESE
VGSLQDEATCPICLEYFREPVTLECGHNFCQACITQPNRKLANVLEIAKRLSIQAAKGAGRERVCGEHQEVLKLFCEEDQRSVCVVCHLSQAYRAHTVVPLEEAAQEYKCKGTVIPLLTFRAPSTKRGSVDGTESPQGQWGKAKMQWGRAKERAEARAELGQIQRGQKSSPETDLPWEQRCSPRARAAAQRHRPALRAELQQPEPEGPGQQPRQLEAEQQQPC